MDIAKLALLGGGAYFLYSYFEKAGAAPSITGTTGDSTSSAANTAAQQAAASAAAAQASAAAAAALAANQAASANTTATIDELKLQQAAWNPTGSPVPGTENAKLTWDQWNWYLARAAVTLGLPPKPSYAPEDVGITDRTQVMTAAQYHAYKDAKGLSGFGRYFIAPGFLPHFEVD